MNRTPGRALAVTLVAGLLAMAAPAMVRADPPPWAPAHGFRAQHGHGYGHHHHRHHHRHHTHHHPHHHHDVHVHEHIHKHVHHYTYEREYEEEYEPGYVPEDEQGRIPPPYPDEAPYHEGFAAGPDGHRELVGGLIGAATGGLLGAQIGDGRGQRAATAAGAVFGYLIGRELGRLQAPEAGHGGY